MSPSNLPFLDKADASDVVLGLSSSGEDHQYYTLELKPDGGRLIGVCVRYTSTWVSDSG